MLPPTARKQTRAARMIGEYFATVPSMAYVKTSNEAVDACRQNLSCGINPRANKTVPQRMTDFQNQVGNSYVMLMIKRALSFIQHSSKDERR
jgi:hypothetical protein